MKRISLIVLGLYAIVLLPFSMAAAQEIKIGYIDTIKIFANFKETTEAEEVYKKEVEAWKKKAEEMESELAQLRESIQSQSLMLSEEKLQEKRLEFDQKARDYQKYMSDIFGDEGEAARRNKELTQPIVEKINAVIAKIAKEENFTVVFDSSQGSIVYADSEIDLTDKVIAELETQLNANQ